MRISGNTMQHAIDAEIDIFGRDQFAGGLLNLFESSDDPLVVALDEKWGTGKTVFAKRLERQATDKGFTVVYFDAFKRDYDPDVFISLSAELLAKIPQDSDKKSSLKENAKTVGKTIGKLALKGGVRFLTAGALKACDFNETSEEVANKLSNIAEAELDALIDRRLDNARVADQTFDKFKISLEKLTKTSQNEDEPAKPLLFIVDELDRCRPDYALSVLETIKHFFSVQNVHFLLVCDIEQLVAAVKNRYGIEDRSIVYLEKFIDVRVNFPEQKTPDRETSIRIFIERTIANMPTDGENGKIWSGLINYMTKTAVSNRYSLRRIEKIVTQFALCMMFTRPEQLRLGAIIHVLCDLKISHPDLFMKSKTGELRYEELIQHYPLDDENDSWYIRWLRYCFDDSINIRDPEWESLSQSLAVYTFGSPAKLASYLANDVVERISA